MCGAASKPAAGARHNRYNKLQSGIPAECVMRQISIVLTAAILLAGSSFGQQKKRVAVMNFDYSTVQGGVAAIFGTNQDVGKGVADLIVEKMVNAGTYSVVERKALDKILSEQNFSNSD